MGTRILIVSDNHYNDDIACIVERHKDVDLRIHLGDSQYPYTDKLLAPFHYRICGNNDFDRRFIDETTITIQHCRMYMTHGHRHDVYFGVDELVASAQRENATIALYGHTHIPFAECIDGVTVINPGSTSYPRGGLRRGTYAILTIADGGHSLKITFFETKSGVQTLEFK